MYKIHTYNVSSVSSWAVTLTAELECRIMYVWILRLIFMAIKYILFCSYFCVGNYVLANKYRSVSRVIYISRRRSFKCHLLLHRLLLTLRYLVWTTKLGYDQTHPWPMSIILCSSLVWWNLTTMISSSGIICRVVHVFVTNLLTIPHYR